MPFSFPPWNSPVFPNKKKDTKKCETPIRFTEKRTISLKRKSRIQSIIFFASFFRRKGQPAIVSYLNGLEILFQAVRGIFFLEALLFHLPELLQVGLLEPPIFLFLVGNELPGLIQLRGKFFDRLSGFLLVGIQSVRLVLEGNISVSNLLLPVGEGCLVLCIRCLRFLSVVDFQSVELFRELLLEFLHPLLRLPTLFLHLLSELRLLLLQRNTRGSLCA